MHWVTETLAYLFTDVFPDTDDVARRSHLHDLAIVWHPVESGVDQQPAFAEHRLDVEGYLHVCGIHVLVLQDHRIEFQYEIVFSVHECKVTKKPQPKPSPESWIIWYNLPLLAEPSIAFISYNQFVLEIAEV